MMASPMPQQAMPKPFSMMAGGRTAAPTRNGNPQNLAAQGRGGDTTIAHLTPGELVVPKEMQTPQVLAVLNQEFQQKGKSPAQYTVGSTEASTNPGTGMQEFGFMDTFLPIALGIGGNLIAPGIGSALGSTLSGAALGSIGSGLGASIGGLATGKDPLSAAMMGAGAGLGSYGIGSLFGGAGSAANPVAETAARGGLDPIEFDTFLSGLTSSNGATPSSGFSFQGMLPSVAGGAAGAGIMSKLMQPNKAAAPVTSENFRSRATPADQIRPFQDALGMTSYQGPMLNRRAYEPRYPGAMSYRSY